MRTAVLILLSIAASGASVAVAQDERASRDGAEAAPPQEKPDEVVVRGKRIAELRVATQSARQRAYDIFNEINSTNDFDVRCADETRGFSHAKQRICRAQFETRISREAGKEYLQGLFLSCRDPTGGQECMFNGTGDRGVAMAQAIESPLQGKRKQMADEVRRLAEQDPRFAQAILDYYKASQEYEAARKGRDDD